MPWPIVLDVDTGTDDDLAILYAVRHPGLEVLAISCVAGNSGLNQVMINTAKVLDAADAPDIPFAAGARQPLIERARPEGAFPRDRRPGRHRPAEFNVWQDPEAATCVLDSPIHTTMYGLDVSAA